MKRVIFAVTAVVALGVGTSAFASTDVSAKGGVEGFTSGGPVGPLAGIQVDTMVNRPLGVELSYDGARIPEGTGLWAHDVNAQLRLCPTPLSWVRPFVAAGLGAGYFEAQDGNFGNGQWSGSAPLSAGVSFGDVRSLNVGLRAEYRYEFSQDLNVAGSPQGNLASGALTLGGRF